MSLYNVIMALDKKKWNKFDIRIMMNEILGFCQVNNLFVKNKINGEKEIYL